MIKDTKTTYILFGIVLIGCFIKYTLFSFIAGHVSEAYFGDFSIAIKLLTILTSLTLFGTLVGSQRFFGKYIHFQEKRQAIHYLAWNLKIFLITFGLSFLLAILSFALMSLLHLWSIHDISQYHLVFYMLWVAPFAALASWLPGLLLLSEHYIIPTLFFRVVRFSLNFLFFYILIYFLDDRLGNIKIVIVLIVSFLIISGVSFAYMRKDIVDFLKIGFKEIDNVPLLHAEWFSALLWINANSIILLFLYTSDLFIVELFGTENEVGYYAAVLTICEFIIIASQSLYEPLKPLMGHLTHPRMDKNKLQEELNVVSRVVLLYGVITTGIICVFSSYLLEMFGETYLVAKPALLILAPGFFITSWGSIANQLLVFAGFEKITMHLDIVLFCMIFIFVSPATYFFGIIGTSIVTSLLISIKAFISIYRVHNQLNLRVLIIY